MYLMNSDLYECDICGFKEKWDAHDDRRGDLWECERCGKHFCTNCFKKACGEEDFRKMLSETDNVLCPECWNSQKSQKEFRINIREILETQVTVDAENKEDALREVEKRWENGEYILDADNFQRVDFWEDEAAKQIELLEKRGASHHRETRRSVFLEQYPNARLDSQNTPYICPADAYGDAVCPTNKGNSYILCWDCRRKFWGQEAE